MWKPGHYIGSCLGKIVLPGVTKTEVVTLFYHCTHRQSRKENACGRHRARENQLGPEMQEKELHPMYDICHEVSPYFHITFPLKYH